MGYWENTVYIQSQSTNVVINELSSMFADEGMVLVSAPKMRKTQAYEPMQYALALKNNLWGIAVFPGNDNWVVIKTAPLDLFGQKEPNENKMRLVLLCTRLKTQGFLFNVYDSGSEILIETNGNGKYSITGFKFSDPYFYYGEQLLDVNESTFESQFKILPFQNIFDDYSSPEDRANALAKTFAGRNMKYCDNFTSVETLINHMPFNAKRGKVLYYKWSYESRVEIDSCSWEEWLQKNNS